MLKRLLAYLLARAQERSTVAGLVMVCGSALGITIPDAMTSNIGLAVAGIAGIVAALVPTSSR